jgi:hypothetical protein
MARQLNTVEKVEQKISLEELRSLRQLKMGVNAAAVPALHRNRFVELGWVEMKFGGYVLTAYGRYQLEVRLRETGLSLLSLRWRQRSEELQTIADSMTTGEANTLRVLAGQWETLAHQLEELERLEQQEPLLG